MGSTIKKMKPKLAYGNKKVVSEARSTKNFNTGGAVAKNMGGAVTKARGGSCVSNPWSSARKG